MINEKGEQMQEKPRQISLGTYTKLPINTVPDSIVKKVESAGMKIAEFGHYEPPKFIVMSACYEIGRYGHDKIKRQTADAHAMGKLSKFIITPHDLIDPMKPPAQENYRFETIQADHADIVIFAEYKKNDIIIKGKEFC
jgi:hypothetical protein